jgi:hypothetical protein
MKSSGGLVSTDSPATHQTGTMSTVVLRVLGSGLSAAGVKVEDHFAKLGICLETLADPDERVSTMAAFALFERIGELTGDPHFGLHAGAGISPGAMEVLDYATRASRTIGEGLERMARYYVLLVENIETKLETAGDLARITHRGVPPLRSPRHAVEFLFAAIVARGRALTGRNWPLRRVRFIHGPPESTAELQHFFAAPLDFGQPFDEIVFDLAFLDQPLATADPSLAAVLDRYVETLLAKLPSADPWLVRVRRAVAETLPGGEPNLESSARVSR